MMVGEAALELPGFLNVPGKPALVGGAGSSDFCVKLQWSGRIRDQR